MKLYNPKFIASLAAVLLIMCFVGIATAATVTVTWVNPTSNTDGTAIPASGPGALTSVRIEYGTCNAGAFGTKAGEVTRTLPATSATLNLQPGTTCVRAFVVNTYGVESDASNVATKTVDPPKPQPPTLTAISPQAFNVKPDFVHFAFVRGTRWGTVKLGAACDESRKTADGYYAVSRRNMVSPRPNDKTVVVASCA